jgi:hypothetical protein
MQNGQALFFRRGQGKGRDREVDFAGALMPGGRAVCLPGVISGTRFFEAGLNKFFVVLKVYLKIPTFHFLNCREER